MYIGSTTRSLRKRLSGHRIFSLHSTSPLSAAMKEIGADHFRILLVMLFPCTCKAELEAEENNVMNECIRSGMTLYNSKINGRYSDAAKEKMRMRQIGNKNGFSGGSISFDKSNNAWVFQWYEDGEKRKKSFSASKWGGNWGARKMAEYLQALTYP